MSQFEKWQCEECGKKFHMRSGFTRHTCRRNSIVLVDNDGRMLCLLCLHEFRDRKESVPHRNDKHPDSELAGKMLTCPFDPPNCRFETRVVCNVKFHLMKTHFKVLRYSACDQCPARFAGVPKRKRHMVEVQQEKP